MKIEHKYLQRFEKRYSVDPDTGCWIFDNTSSPDGYGRFTIYGKYMQANRAAWLLYRGPIPEKMDVAHRCHNRPCVNPDHLYIATRSENMNNKLKDVKHAVGENNHSTKLTDEQVRQLRADVDLCERQLGEKYQIHPGTAGRIRRGELRKYVKD